MNGRYRLAPSVARSARTVRSLGPIVGCAPRFIVAGRVRPATDAIEIHSEGREQVSIDAPHVLRKKTAFNAHPAMQPLRTTDHTGLGAGAQSKFFATQGERQVEFHD